MATSLLKEVEASSVRLHIDKAKIPSQFGLELLEFQQQTVTWMVEREDAVTNAPQPRGGVLASEAGLGKTIMSIALIAAQRQRQRQRQEHQGTLVLTSAGRLEHWKNEVSHLKRWWILCITLDVTWFLNHPKR